MGVKISKSKKRPKAKAKVKHNKAMTKTPTKSKKTAMKKKGKLEPIEKKGKTRGNTTVKHGAGAEVNKEPELTSNAIVPEGKANVAYNMGYTKNMGDYESLRIDVSLSIPCETDAESIESAREVVWNWCNDRVFEALQEFLAKDQKAEVIESVAEEVEPEEEESEARATMKELKAASKIAKKEHGEEWCLAALEACGGSAKSTLGRSLASVELVDYQDLIDMWEGGPSEDEEEEDDEEELSSELDDEDELEDDDLIEEDDELEEEDDDELDDGEEEEEEEDDDYDDLD